MDTLNHEFVDPLDADALLGDSLAGDLAADLDHTEFPAADLTDPEDGPDEEIERARTIHLMGVGTYSRQIDDARRHRDEQLAEIEDDRQTITAWFQSEMTRLDGEMDTVRAKAKKRICASARLLRISRAALEVALS